MRVPGGPLILLSSRAAGLVYLDGGAALATAGADAQLCLWGPSDEEPHSYQVRSRISSFTITTSGYVSRVYQANLYTITNLSLTFLCQYQVQYMSGCTAGRMCVSRMLLALC